MAPDALPGTPVPPSQLSPESTEARELRARVVAALGDSYDVGDEIGRGGMAVVYAATDKRLRRPVALKVLPPEMAYRSDVRARFIREAQTAARLNHPNIVPIYNVDERGGIVYIAMALVKGESAAEVVKRSGSATPELVASVLAQVADALAYAHAAGVVHRDIKPDNILIDSTTGRAAVTDFGIARAMESDIRLTQTGIAVGTPAYMSPEQATGERDVDGRSDIYSVGVVGFLMLTGKLPFEAPNTPAMLLKHISETPPRVRDVRSDVPVALAAVLDRCMNKLPAARFADAGELGEAIRSAMSRGGSPVANATANANANVPPGASRPLSQQPYRPKQISVPPLSPDATEEEFRKWRREVRGVRRENAKNEDSGRPVEAVLPRSQPTAGDPSYSIRGSASTITEIRRFQARLIRSAFLVAGLTFINAMTAPHFPWVIFAAFGIGMSRLNGFLNLHEQGIRLRDILPGGIARLESGVRDPLTSATQVSRTVSQLRTALRWAAGFGVAGAAFVVMGTRTPGTPLFPFLVSATGALGSVLIAGSAARRLRRFGISFQDAITSRWRDKVQLLSGAPRANPVDEEFRRAGGDVLPQGRYTRSLREAAADLVAIREASMKLSDADRALVPDATPTADALFERIGVLATALSRLDEDIPAGSMAGLSEKIAQAEREPASVADRERRLGLLYRQKESLEALDKRRATLNSRMESAQLALHSLRLDMIRLRALGVGSVIDDVTTTTHDASALSSNIGRAIEVADELRKLD